MTTFEVDDIVGVDNSLFTEVKYKGSIGVVTSVTEHGCTVACGESYSFPSCETDGQHLYYSNSQLSRYISGEKLELVES